MFQRDPERVTQEREQDMGFEREAPVDETKAELKARYSVPGRTLQPPSTACTSTTVLRPSPPSDWCAAARRLRATRANSCGLLSSARTNARPRRCRAERSRRDR